MRYRLAAGSVARVLAFAGTAGAAPSEEVHIRKIDVASFPKVAITASVDGEATARSLTVTENGSVINEFSVESLSESGRKIDVTLVIDTSGSMKGEPIA